MERDVLVPGQPLIHARAGVRGEVIKDHMSLPTGVPCCYLVHEFQKLARAAPGKASAGHLTRPGIQRCEQVGRAVALVIMGAFLGLAEANRAAVAVCGLTPVPVSSRLPTAPPRRRAGPGKGPQHPRPWPRNSGPATT